MIAPGSVIGIIGGGQLGRMLAQAAAELGYKAHIFTPEEDSPASQVAWKTTVAPYADIAALKAFAAGVEVITFEFENIPHESLEALGHETLVRPSPLILKVSRNRNREKRFINDLGIATTAFRPVRTPGELAQAMTELGLPAILKTAEMGYDGKGQMTLRQGADADAAWRALHAEEAILEAVVDFRMEISVIVARGAKGQARCYVPVQNIHAHHILDTTVAPAPIGAALAEEAEAMAMRIAERLQLQGLLAVEMFITRDERILVNELAPRPHNSGHWTMDACITGQFEQAIRAVCDLPLGNPARLCSAEMKNLIGDDVKNWQEWLKNPNAKLHLYGKAESRPARKMGHVTLLLP